MVSTWPALTGSQSLDKSVASINLCLLEDKCRMTRPVESEHDHASVAAEPNQHSHQETIQSERSDNLVIIIIIIIIITVIVTVTIITWERLCSVE